MTRPAITDGTLLLIREYLNDGNVDGALNLITDTLDGKAGWFVGDAGGHHFVLPEDPYTNRGIYLSIDGHPVEIVHVRRRRDGGTTIIETAGGTLVIPSPLRPGEAPKWTVRTTNLQGGSDGERT